MRLCEVTDRRNGHTSKAWVNPDRILYAKPYPLIVQQAASHEEAVEKGIYPLRCEGDGVWIAFTTNDGVLVSLEDFAFLQEVAGIHVVKAPA